MNSFFFQFQKEGNNFRFRWLLRLVTDFEILRENEFRLTNLKKGNFKYIFEKKPTKFRLKN